MPDVQREAPQDAVERPQAGFATHDTRGAGNGAPDELVVAVVKSLRADGVGVVSEVADRALQAAFAKLPECEAVAEIAYQAVATEWGIGRQQTREALQVALTALAREFGCRE